MIFNGHDGVIEPVIYSTQLVFSQVYLRVIDNMELFSLLKAQVILRPGIILI